MPTAEDGFEFSSWSLSTESLGHNMSERRYVTKGVMYYIYETNYAHEL